MAPAQLQLLERDRPQGCPGPDSGGSSWSTSTKAAASSYMLTTVPVVPAGQVPMGSRMATTSCSSMACLTAAIVYRTLETMQAVINRGSSPSQRISHAVRTFADRSARSRSPRTGTMTSQWYPASARKASAGYRRRTDPVETRLTPGALADPPVILTLR
jgi:hypothetical protein